MAQFQQMVLDYLEHYQPEQYEALKQERRLRAHMDDLVDELYLATEAFRVTLTGQYPDRSEEQLSLEAELLAVEAILPEVATISDQVTN